MAKKKPLYLRTFRKMKRDVRKLSAELEAVKNEESKPKVVRTSKNWSFNWNLRANPRVVVTALLIVGLLITLFVGDPVIEITTETTTTWTTQTSK